MDIPVIYGSSRVARTGEPSVANSFTFVGVMEGNIEITIIAKNPQANQHADSMTLYIKNMVCNRCIMVVQRELENQGLHPEKLSLGEVTISEDHLSELQQKKLDEGLVGLGFERIDDRKARLIEAMKNKIIQIVHQSPRIDLKVNWSTILSEELHYEYNYLSNLFSSVEGITVEQYIIRQKIEKVKELLFYDELNLSEIANRMGYSSVAHLSAQFKKVTGLTPSEMKKSRDLDHNRKSLDSIH